MSKKTAIVTGGNSGLGFATAKKLCDNGIITYIIGRSKEKTEDACKEIGENAIPVIFDLNNLAGIPAMIENITKENPIAEAIAKPINIPNKIPTIPNMNCDDVTSAVVYFSSYANFTKVANIP